MTKEVYSNSCTMRDVGRLVADHIIRRFQEGSWKYNVDLKVDKTKPGWLDTKVDIRFKWTGSERDVNLYTLAAKDYLNQIGG